MKKLLFYCRVNRDDVNNAGVIKKCYGQVDGFRKLGLDVDMVWLCNEGVLLNEELIYRFKTEMKPHTIRMYIFYFFGWHSLLKKKLSLSDYDFFYFRYELAHFNLINFFKKIKSLESTQKIILEIPTYPYEKELRGGTRKLQLIIDRIFRIHLKKYLDLITSYSLHQMIYGVKVLPISNGINLEIIPFSNTKPEPNHVRLIAVGYWRYWHGLDRVLMGLGEYYSRKRRNQVIVSFHIIGEGEEVPKLKRLTAEHGLSDVVEFSKALTDTKLNIAFSKSDIGVGDLGSFRKGLNLVFSLKHREYAARGIPFVYSTPDSDFDLNSKCTLKVESGNSPIDIENLISFHQSLSPQNRINLREHAEKKLAWSSKLRPIVNFLIPLE